MGQRPDLAPGQRFEKCDVFPLMPFTFRIITKLSQMFFQAIHILWIRLPDGPVIKCVAIFWIEFMRAVKIIFGFSGM